MRNMKFLLVALVVLACVASTFAEESDDVLAAQKVRIAELKAQLSQYKVAASGGIRVQEVGEGTGVGSGSGSGNGPAPPSAAELCADTAAPAGTPTQCGTTATGTCCASNAASSSSAKSACWKSTLPATGGEVVGTGSKNKWISKCNTKTPNSLNGGFSSNLFFVIQKEDNTYYKQQCNYQTGVNLNLGTSGRLTMKGGGFLDWTCLSRLQKFAARLPKPGKPASATAYADTYAGFAQVKMIKLTVCTTSGTGAKECSEKKVVLQCHQASCGGTIHTDYGCMSGGSVADSNNAAWTYPAATATSNCKKLPLIAAGMLP